MGSDDRSINVYELGTTSYGDVHRLQRRLQVQRRDGAGVDSLLLTEHRPVLTLGRSHPEPDLRVPLSTVAHYGIEIHQTERGGDITYHGPGQLVAYGIIDLKGWDLGVLDYVGGLEDTVIGVLADWGLRAERKAGARGVWIDGRKIASLGLNVRRWVTMHGIALNVDPDMSHFDLINPCGMADVEMTSLSVEMGKTVDVTEVVEPFIFHFGRVFGCTTEIVDLNERRPAM
ncbi:MAG: lipoyl(octanoyl) transferase LipB [Dehalococcoidia bacterium]|nr:lipoyl(octanoyl) transferase LipB [Dehalococcoidia bacterium]